MGGALALYAGLTYPHKLGGIIGLSSFLIQRDKLPGVSSPSRLQGLTFFESLFCFPGLVVFNL